MLWHLMNSVVSGHDLEYWLYCLLLTILTMLGHARHLFSQFLTLFCYLNVNCSQPGQLTATGRHWLSPRLRGISRHPFLPQNWALPCAIQFPVSPLNTRFYYSNVGYVLAQVMSLTFCKQMLRSVFIKYSFQRYSGTFCSQNGRLNTCSKTSSTLLQKRRGVFQSVCVFFL